MCYMILNVTQKTIKNSKNIIDEEYTYYIFENKGEGFFRVYYIMKSDYICMLQPLQ